MFRFGMSGGSFFEQVVSDTCEYLRDSFPNELGKLTYRIEDLPAVIPENGEVKKFQLDRVNTRIVLYRIPIQRMHKLKYSDPQMQIERVVFDAAAELIDKDPWDLIHPAD